MSNKLTPENTLNKKVAERVISKLKKADNNCIEWTAARDPSGYGIFNVTVAPNETVSVKAHRWMVQYAMKELIPSSVFVCHRCDNPSCVNLEHLFLGSNQDNVNDMVAKGRQKSKLDKNDVVNIRSALAIGNKTDLQIATEYGISRRHVNDIKHRQSWKHV